MVFGVGDMVGIEFVGGICFVVVGDCGYVFFELQIVVIIVLVFIILGDQLQLVVIIDFNCFCFYYVEVVRVLEFCLGIIEDQCIVIVVVLVVEMLIGY